MLDFNTICLLYQIVKSYTDFQTLYSTVKCAFLYTSRPLKDPSSSLNWNLLTVGTKLKVPSHLLGYKHNVLWNIKEFEDLNKQEKHWLSWVQNKRTQSRGPTRSFGKLGCKLCHCARSCNLYPIWANYMCCLPHRKKKLSENLLSADLHGALLIGDPYAGLLYLTFF